MMQHTLANTKLYTHPYHIEIAQSAIDAGVVTESEVFGVNSAENRMMRGTRLTDKNKASFNARDRIFLHDLQTNKALLAQQLAYVIGLEHSIDRLDISIYLGTDGKFTALFPSNEEKEYSYSLDLSDDGVVLTIDNYS